MLRYGLSKILNGVTKQHFGNIYIEFDTYLNKPLKLLGLHWAALYDGDLKMCKILEKIRSNFEAELFISSSQT